MNLELSSKEISIRARLDPSLVTRYEKGERLPTRAHLAQLAESLNLNFHQCLQLWLSEQVEKVFEQEDETTRKEVLRHLLGGSSMETSSDDRLMNKVLDQLERFSKCKLVYASEWQTYREEQQLRAFAKLCQMLQLDFSSEELNSILVAGKTVARHNLQDHLILHQLYQAWQTSLTNVNKAILDGLAWFQQYASSLNAASPKQYKGWTKLKTNEELLTAFIAWHKQAADAPIRLYLNAVFLLKHEWPLLYESSESDENFVLEELNKRLIRAIEAMES